MLAVQGDLGIVQTTPISGNVSINSTTDYASDIVIADGGVLNINSTLRMAQDRKIVIEPGGKLILNAGSKITSISDCGNISWHGIHVGGNSNQPQVESLQGMIEINGTAQSPVTIENAVDAISTLLTLGHAPKPQLNWQSFSGIIKADYCIFENNLRDVQFMKYNFPNTSYFNHCIFLKDREFVTPNTRGGFVSMWDVHGVTFKACTFEYDGVPYEDQAVKHGIFSIAASFTVTWDCQNPNQTTGCTGADSSYFKNIEFGIRAEYTRGFNGSFTEVHGTEFKCINGAYLGASHNHIATRNSFYTEKVAAFTYPNIPYGLYLDYASGFMVQENEFYSYGSAAHSAGLVINTSGSLSNLVYNNKFDNYQMGISAQGNNRSIGGQTGLECRCNDFTDGNYDISIYGNSNQPWNGIRREQGNLNPLVLASNLFSLTGTAFSDYFNSPDYINYRHHAAGFNGNSISLEPSDIFNVFKTNYDLVYTPCVKLINSGKTSSQLQAEIGVAQEAIGEDEDLLIQLLNEEEIWMLEAQILFASMQGDWYDVYLDMMQQSPYLDFGIIEGLIQDPTFPDLMLRNIMLANPDASKDDHLLTLISQRNMPTWMVDDIIAGQSSYGAKEVLVGRIGYNKGVQHTAIGSLMRIYGSSTTYNSLDSIANLLQNRPEAQYHYMLADAYLAKGQYTQALAVVYLIPETTSYTEKDSLDYSAYQSWYALQAALIETSQTMMDVDSTQTATLQTLADTTNHNAPMLWATNALKLLGQETDYLEPVYLPNEVSQKQQSITSKVIEHRSLVIAFPNPTSDLLNIVVNGAEKIAVQLYSLSGQSLMSVDGKFGTAVLNVSNLPTGVYLVKVSDGKTFTETIRISVVK